MNIAITGATGVIGRHAVQQLINAGHRVTGVTRSARGERALEGLGARPVRADVFDEVELRSAFAGADAVVNLLTHIPPADRMAAPGAWDENDRLRGEASAAIARAAQAAGAARLVQESLAFVYADGGDAGSTRRRPWRAAGPPRRRWPPRPTRASSSPGTRSSCASGSSSAPTAGSRRRTSTRRGGAASRRASAAATRTGRRYGSMTPRPRWPPRWTLRPAPTTWSTPTRRRAARSTRRSPRSSAAAVSVPAIEEIPPALEPVARSQRVSSRRLREATGWKPRVRGGTEGWRLIVAEGVAA